MAREIRACNAERITIHGDITTVCLVLLPLDDNMLISQVGQFLEKFNLELHEDIQGIS